MFNYGFELFVNLFQGVMFTVFCYKFLTPSRNKICEGIAFCVASLLMFLSITLINWLYLSFAYIETVVFFAIMIPYCILFFKDRIFVKILTPVIWMWFIQYYHLELIISFLRLSVVTIIILWQRVPNIVICMC